MNEGDRASATAYGAAKATFIGRKGMIGEPVVGDGGFAGCLDMGDFYLVQNDDGVGSKEIIAEAIGKFDTLGYDLLAMVVDDGACVGAEVLTCSNTMDVKKVDSERIGEMMEGLKNACLEHKVVIPGGEIAELNTMLNNGIWNATAVGIVEKHKLITGMRVKAGDKVIALQSAGFRSNGFSLVRHVLTTALGENAYLRPYSEDGSDGGHSKGFLNKQGEKSWGEMLLTPSRIYYSLIMDLHGRFKEPSKIDLHGVVHITGGGLPGNLPRALKSPGLGIHLDNLFPAHEMMKRLQRMGNISDEEAYEVWNMGNGMCVIVDEKDADTVLERAKALNIPAQVAGTVNTSDKVTLTSKGAISEGEVLEFAK